MWRIRKGARGVSGGMGWCVAAKKKKRLTKAQAEALRKKRSRAAKRAWSERKAKAKRRSEAAKKAAATRKRKALETAKKRKPAPKPAPKTKKRKKPAPKAKKRKSPPRPIQPSRPLPPPPPPPPPPPHEPPPIPPWNDRLIRDFENITYRGRFVEDIEIVPNPDGSVMIFGYVEILGRRVQVQAYQVETETSGSRFWGQLQNTQAGNPVAAFEEGLYEDQDAPDAPDFITGWYDEAFDEDAA